MLNVIIYRRAECHLCDDALLELSRLADRYPHRVISIDIDTDDELQRKYGLEIPVIEIGPYTLKAPIEKEALAVTLSAAFDRKQQLEEIQDPDYVERVKRGSIWSKADGIALWISRHYMAFLIFVVGLYVGLPFLAPIFMKAGVNAPAYLIYKMYGIVCHQLGYRSFYLFGEQVFYPREIATGGQVKSFQEATGLPEDNSAESIFSARQFIGNNRVGYKVALCERDVAIYAGILIFSILFSWLRNRIPEMPWYIWILVGLVPIGLDGVSQIISQPPFSLIPYRESTPLLRVVTGGLFGFFTAWFGLPSVEESMAQTRSILTSKKIRLQKWEASPTGEMN